MPAEEDAVRTRIPSDEPASVAVVRTVAAYANRRPTDLEPLYETVDADALDALLAHDGDCTVRFRYCGCLVAVSADEVVVA